MIKEIWWITKCFVRDKLVRFFFGGERQSVSMLLTIRTEQITRCLLQCEPHFSFSAYRQLILLILDTYSFTVFSKQYTQMTNTHSWLTCSAKDVRSYKSHLCTFTLHKHMHTIHQQVKKGCLVSSLEKAASPYGPNCCYSQKSKFQLENEHQKFSETIPEVHQVFYLWSTVSVDGFDDHASHKWASTKKPFMLVLFDAICVNSGYVGTCELPT